MFEEHICPLCGAFQNPDTGECLICGKSYHILDIPASTLVTRNGYAVGDFLVPLPNGFLTFKAIVEMTVEQEQRPTLQYNKEEIPSAFRNEAKLTFHFVADNDEKGTLFQIYTGRHFN